MPDDDDLSSEETEKIFHYEVERERQRKLKAKKLEADPNGAVEQDPAEALEQIARRQEGEAPKGRGERRNGPPPVLCFKLVRFADLKLDVSGNYVIKGLIPREGLVVIWGPPKCGKSFITFDLFLHIALGWEYRSHRVTQGVVVYCALEGQGGFAARKEAFCLRHEIADAPLYLMFTPLDLVKAYTLLIRDIEAQLPPSTMPIAVVIDTLNRSLSGSENKDEDMSAYIQAADTIRAKFKCVVVIVHHCGIDGTRPRGHTSLIGADDVQIAVKRDEDKTIIFTVEHMKDGQEGETIASKLEVVEVGHDKDGDPITSCVVVPTEPEPQPRADKRQKLTDRQANTLVALRKAILDHGIDSPPDFPPLGAKVVTLDQWKAELISRGLLKDDRRIEPRYREIRTPLLSRGLIGIRAPFVWVELS
jgi:hypothetical protein